MAYKKENNLYNVKARTFTVTGENKTKEELDSITNIHHIVANVSEFYRNPCYQYVKEFDNGEMIGYIATKALILKDSLKIVDGRNIKSDNEMLIPLKFYPHGELNSVDNKIHTDNTVPANAVTSFDVTVSTSKKPVTLYTIDDGLGNGTYKAVITSNDVIYAPSDCKDIFRNMDNLTTFNSTNFKVDRVTTFYTFFADDYELENINTISTWNTSNVENMMYMFQKNYKLTNTFALSNWNVGSVQNMTALFQLCTNLTNITPLANWYNKLNKLENM